VTNVIQDLRFAFRTFTKSPVFVIVAVLSLALGIGANTAIFTLVDQILLRLLPIKNPEQLILLTARGQHYGSNNGPNKLSYVMYEDFRDHNQVFSGMFCRWDSSFSLSYQGKTERISGELTRIPGVSTSFFTPDIANHVPHMQISWDSRVPLDSKQVSQMLRNSKPSIVIGGGEGRPGLTMCSFMLQPGEDKIVAEQLSRVLREHSA